MAIIKKKTHLEWLSVCKCRDRDFARACSGSSCSAWAWWGCFCFCRPVWPRSRYVRRCRPWRRDPRPIAWWTSLSRPPGPPGASWSSPSGPASRTDTDGATAVEASSSGPQGCDSHGKVLVARSSLLRNEMFCLTKLNHKKIYYDRSLLSMQVGRAGHVQLSAWLLQRTFSKIGRSRKFFQTQHLLTLFTTKSTPDDATSSTTMNPQAWLETARTNWRRRDLFAWRSRSARFEPSDRPVYYRRREHSVST